MTRASDTARLIGAGATINDGTTITTDDNTDQLTLISTDADANRGPRLALTRNSSSPADSDVAGTIKFNAKNDAAEDIELFEITTTITDASDGTEDAKMTINGIIGGASTNRLNLTNSEAVFNEDSVDMDFRIESNGDANTFFVNGANGKVGLGTTSPDAELHVEPADDGTAASIVISNSGRTQWFRIQNNETDDRLVISRDDSQELIQIFDNGNTCFGTTNQSPAEGTGTGARIGSAGKTQLSSTGDTCLFINRVQDGRVVALHSAGTLEGEIGISGSTTTYGAFTGTHWSRLTDNTKPTILLGTVIETIDAMCDWYQVKFEADGTTKKVGYALKEGEKVGDTITYTYKQDNVDDANYQATIIKEDDNKHPKCKISDTADSKSVYGVFCAWDDDDDTINDMKVASLGTHVVRVHSSATVSKGDLLVSNGDGTAKVQDDDIIRSKTIGKVLTNIKQETYSDGSYTVPCALYCG